MTYIIHLVFSYLNITHILTCQVLFFWADTSQGWNYWEELNWEWLDYAEKEELDEG